MGLANLEVQIYSAFLKSQKYSTKSKLLTHSEPRNMETEAGAGLCRQPSYQLCLHISTDSIVKNPNKVCHYVRASYTCSTYNMIYAFFCQWPPSAPHKGQGRQSWHKRMNGHKSDINDGNIKRFLGE